MTNVSKIFTVAPIGFEGKEVEVESDMSNGLPGFQLVGLAHRSIDEAKERVKSAIVNSKLSYPSKKLTVNLAPAQLPKEGTHYDLPIALAILESSKQLRPENTKDCCFAGELALNGDLRPIVGAISIAEAAKSAGRTKLYLPKQNASQAALVRGITVYGVGSLKELFLHLKQQSNLTPYALPEKDASLPSTPENASLDSIIGQEQAKRAIVIAAAGKHNVLLSGSPGAGKTMLGKILPYLLPDMDLEEQLAVTKLHSLGGSSIDSLITSRPFRAPHHTSSKTSIVGGGAHPKPGELSLAHHGVLLLDEIPEYPRATLEALRQPLEDRTVCITRANGRATYPADAILVATMNPCPCGFNGDTLKECTCTAHQVDLYQKRLSGPLLDRIDMKLTVNRVPNEKLLADNTLSFKQHNEAREAIKKARIIQKNRYKSSGIYNNNTPSSSLKSMCNLSPQAESILLRAADKLQLSARATFKVLRVARTIADLDNSPAVDKGHITEALLYR